MSKIIEELERAQLRSGIPQFKAGDTVRVHFQVIEGERRRLQVFEGVVIKRQGAGVRETFTVRKQSFGVASSGRFRCTRRRSRRSSVTAIGDVNRAKLYYLRGRVGKRARVREIRQDRSKAAPSRPSHRRPSRSRSPSSRRKRSSPSWSRRTPRPRSVEETPAAEAEAPAEVGAEK